MLLIPCFALFCFLLPAYGLQNGVALTPPMGWLSWAAFGCQTDCVNYSESCINEKLYTSMADRLVDDGWRELGYVFVNIDDCWSEMERDKSTQELIADRQRFPNGIKWLADYMHQRGLKLGIYADYGEKTCGGYPGSEGHYEIDARTFARWEVDSVKLDACNADPAAAKEAYPDFGRQLNKTGRAIVYSCEWPFKEFWSNITSNYSAVAEYCNLFRNFNDVAISYSSIKSIVVHYRENNDGFLQVSGPGNFNDPDMIVAGNSGLPVFHQRLQLGMWAIFAAPFYMSNDLRNISHDSRKLLQNKDLINIQQDPLGLSGFPVDKEGAMDFWVRKLANGNYAVAAVVLEQLPDDRPAIAFKSLSDLGISAPVDGMNFKGVEIFDKVPVYTVDVAQPVVFVVQSTSLQLFLFSPLDQATTPSDEF